MINLHRITTILQLHECFSPFQLIFRIFMRTSLTLFGLNFIINPISSSRNKLFF